MYLVLVLILIFLYLYPMNLRGMLMYLYVREDAIMNKQD